MLRNRRDEACRKWGEKQRWTEIGKKQPDLAMRKDTRAGNGKTQTQSGQRQKK